MGDRTKTVTSDGEAVSLTPTEYDILKLFNGAPRRGLFFCTDLHRRLARCSVWSEGTVAVHIRHLREKLEINPAEPRYLKVVWGQGYKLEGGTLMKQLSHRLPAKIAAILFVCDIRFALRVEEPSGFYIC